MTPDDLDHALGVLSQGGIVAAATETFFGLLADARNGDAIGRIFSLKGRDAARGLALVLPNRAAWSPLVHEIPPLAARLADAFWPGPLTIALSAAPHIDPRLQVDGTIGVRLAGPSDASRLATAFGFPLTATSANRAGDPPAEANGDVAHAFADAVADRRLTVLAGRAPGGKPSTLVLVEGDRLRLLRQGQISERELAGIVPATAFG